MIDKAVAKLNAEMQKEPDNRYLEILGHYAIDRCDQALASKLTGGRTLKGAMEAVVKRAKAARAGSVAVLTPTQVFGEVDKYFGLSPDTDAQWRAMGLPAAASGQAEPQPSGGDIDPLDFL